jgi:LytTr DNA-binding domain-containing protein
MISEYLNQAFPLPANKWKVIIPISAFIGVFMVLFQPFGLINYHDTYKTLIFLGYGLVTFLVLVFNLFIIQTVFKKYFELKNWTVGKQILWLMWIIFTIGIANYLYSSAIFSIFEGFKAFLLFQFFTVIIGIIPIVVVTIVTQNVQLSYNLKEAHEFNNKLGTKNKLSDSGRTICLIADNEKDKFDVELSYLLYIESFGNYIRVCYSSEDKPENIVLRSSLKRIESQLSDYPAIVKCHRAFLVNVSQIAKVKGNSQGLRLTLQNLDIEIPVSRAYSKELKDKINPY